MVFQVNSELSDLIIELVKHYNPTHLVWIECDKNFPLASNFIHWFVLFCFPQDLFQCIQFVCYLIPDDFLMVTH